LDPLIGGSNPPGPIVPLSSLGNRQCASFVVPRDHANPFTLMSENPMHRLAARRLACTLALAALLAPGSLDAQDSARTTPPPLLTAPLPGPRLGKADAAEVRRKLQSTADAWNRAALAGHVAPYADSAAFMTGRGPMIGRDKIESSLRRGFWRDGKPVQTLRYEHVNVRALGRDHALVTGRFVLTGGGREDASGWFSLVWERGPQGWQEIHDHSS
jgi:ketosteroid isomerase-like protein